MKNTAKTLTLTAKKAPAKSTAQLSVPKTATSYFLETEAASGAPAAKVTVVKTRSRLASLKAAQTEQGTGAETAAQFQAAQLEPGQFDQAAAEGVAEADAVAPVVAAIESSLPADQSIAEAAAAAEAAPAVTQIVTPHAAVATDAADPLPAAPAAPPVIVRKRASKLAALKAAEPAPAPEAVSEPAPAVAETAAPDAPAARAVRTRTARRVEAGTSSAPNTPAGAPATGTVSTTTDAATLAAIDTSGYTLPGVKVPGRRGRKPSEFTPENDEIAALNAVERAELKAASKLRERKAKGIPNILGAEAGFSSEELERRRTQLKNLINMGKERGYLTHAEINDQLPENIIDPEQIEGIIATFNDMGIAVYERAP